MSVRVPAAAPMRFTWSDIVALCKPGILIFALMTTAGAMSLAPGAIGVQVWLPLFLGTGLIVASANVLNMFLEQDTDALMERTRTRPLRAGVRRRPGSVP